MTVKPVPDGYHTVTPYLVVPGVARHIDFLKQAFGAEETYRMTLANGTVTHAEVRIGDSRVMLGQAGGPHQPTPCLLYLYLPDVDILYERALAAGGTSHTAPANQFYGDRTASVLDPAGNQWWIATHVEDVPEEEVARRAEARAKESGH